MTHAKEITDIIVEKLTPVIPVAYAEEITNAIVEKLTPLLEKKFTAEAELDALQKGLRVLTSDMRSREIDPWYWSEIADEIDALLGED